MRRVVEILCLVVVGGCSSTPADPNTPGDGGLSTSTVTGRSYTRCRQVPGDVEVPVDLSKSVIQALVLFPPNREYLTLDGAGRADGTFSIPRVTDDVPYLLRVDELYIATSQRSVELYRDQPGRCAPVPARALAPTPVALELTGMTPFATGDNETSDSLVVGSFALAYQSLGLDAGVAAGDTTVATTHDWMTGEPPPPLPDAAAGDDFHVLHYRTERVVDPATQRAYTATRLLDTLQRTDVTLRSGASARVTGPFQPAALNRTVSFAIDHGLFTAASNGLSVFTEPLVTITAQPRGHDVFNAFARRAAILAEFDAFAPPLQRTPKLAVTDHRYADPFPAHWQRTAAVQVLQLRDVRHPIDMLTKPIDEYAIATHVGLDRITVDFTGTVDTVPLQKPRPRLGGIDISAGGYVKIDGARPVPLAWDPVPSATSYVINLRRVNPDGADDATTSVAVVRTVDTTLLMPASMFAGGQYFLLAVSAIRASLDDGADPLFTADAPSAIATAMSGRLRLGEQCGDFFMNDREQCDGGPTESAFCNADCTTPRCGDGLRNAANREACDTIRDTPGCDSDCTLPVCGDNHLNQVVEDCDDGNTVNDGNGCGTDCRLSTCGNRTVDTGEICDDGNLTNLDGCSNTCEIEVPEIEPNEDGTPSLSPPGGGLLGNDFAVAHADSNGAFTRTTTILGRIGSGGDEDVFAIVNPFSDGRAFLRVALRDPGLGPAVTCSSVPRHMLLDATGVFLAFDRRSDAGDCGLVDFILDPGQRVYVQVIDAQDNGDTFPYALQVRLGRFVEP